MGVLLVLLLIGFAAGIVARLLAPGPNTPKGFVVTTLIGIAGVIVASAAGEAVGIYRMGQGAGLVGASAGALLILLVWNRLVAAGVIPDHGLL
jgi:uncharacterized membrane protein YeaQ/YmgE (transglycosylase-associated protein family)